MFGLRFRPTFTLTLDLGSLDRLLKVKRYFGCGKIYSHKRRNVAEFVVDNNKDLLNIIIPHFLKYPLVLDKLHSFNLFVFIVNALINKTHQTMELRRKLLGMALSINTASQRSDEWIDELYLKLGIENGISIPLIPNTEVTITTEITNEFITGFIDGDGSFMIIFNKDGTQKLMVNLTGYYTIIPLLELIRKRLSGIGSIATNEGISRWLVTGLDQINDNMIPFMNKEVLHTEKSVHYDIFRQVCSILTKGNLSLSDRLKIVELAYNSNKEGKRRKISKEDYIKILSKIYEQ